MTSKRDHKIIELCQNEIKNYQEDVQNQINQLQNGLREEIRQSTQTFRQSQDEAMKQYKQTTIQDVRQLLREELNKFRQESREEIRSQNRTNQTDNIQNSINNLPFINSSISNINNLPITNYNASTSGSSSTSSNIPSNPVPSETSTSSNPILNAPTQSNSNPRNPGPTIRSIKTLQTNSIQNFKTLTPDKFDGSSSWNEYKIHFEIIASCNKWTDDIKASFLGASLQGKARNILNKLTMVELSNYKKLTEILDKQFNKKHLSRMNLIKLKSRKQEKHENLEKFAEEIDKLIDSAFYGRSMEDREEMACVYFIEGIYDKRIRYNLSYERPQTLSAALEHATVSEALSESIYPKDSKTNNSFPSDNRDSYGSNENSKPNNTGSNNNNKNLKCFHCDKTGHLARQCTEPNPR